MGNAAPLTAVEGARRVVDEQVQVAVLHNAALGQALVVLQLQEEGEVGLEGEEGAWIGGVQEIEGTDRRSSVGLAQEHAVGLCAVHALNLLFELPHRVER